VKLVRVLSRIALLSLVAAAFVGLTRIYGSSALPPSPNPRWQAEHSHRSSAPQIGYFPEFLAEGMLLALYAVGDARYFGCGYPLCHAEKDNRSRWTCTENARLP
jgi:hypothetical protein